MTTLRKIGQGWLTDGRSQGAGAWMAAIGLAVLLLAPLSAAHSVAPANAGARPAAAQAATPQVLLLISSFNTFVPENLTVWGSTVVFLLTNNDSEAHEVVFSSHVNKSVDWTTSASNASGSWFAAPNLLADQMVSASSTTQFTVNFPSPGTYQFIDRAYFNLAPYDSSGNVTVHPIPAATTSSTTSSSSPSATSTALYAGGGLAAGFLLGAAVAGLIIRRKK